MMSLFVSRSEKLFFSDEFVAHRWWIRQWVGLAVDCNLDGWNGVILFFGSVKVGCIGKILSCVNTGIEGTIFLIAKSNGV